MLMENITRVNHSIIVKKTHWNFFFRIHIQKTFNVKKLRNIFESTENYVTDRQSEQK